MIPVEQLVAPGEQVILKDIKGHAVSTRSNDKDRVKIVLTSTLHSPTRSHGLHEHSCALYTECSWSP
jgi:hypothetical protein